ncbi:3' exoribonuclease [Candidatus Amoebophilus asiaticus 5a2]|uniref:Polyribonucleotide nucleotidyltransferase n=1 Tax=Amoebophilus asiaticus (strain 5a2) TaxID=452471 RepID=PNP_AMOA5|nr:polyribonucleotide nucleotidyltransferase [Candidatus Amoebophilus asiaticus]B3EU51.1 RecName: Full=Polyribonucleotide nucleotidyltransferase; AltName: Full=Polynucleotide phosphorylase; Short=PNPase [Candidatus Amoebophilus asiaticus 5a2]ACE05470.1 3' exoribonuclease [Candidatus Amoebophilus asiaticus 5a2]
MLNKIISKTISLPEHREITIETGKLAKQADGSVVVRMGDTMLLATVVFKQELDPTVDFLPLHVEYQEKFAAAGKIPGGFLRREGKLGDHEVLISRLVDRAIRPLFPDNYKHETQINIFLISADPEILPESLAGLAASAALMISPIPFEGPISEVRVARIDGQFVVNPTQSALEKADIDLMVGGSEKNILMVEGEMDEVQEADIIAAIQFAHEAIKLQCQVQKELADAVATLKFEAEPLQETENFELKDRTFKALYDKVYATAKKGITNKHLRKSSFKQIKKEYLKELLQQDPETSTVHFDKYYYELEKQVVRDLALNEGLRLDGRKLDEIRAIESEIDYLPAAHGSSLFTRGETQSLTTVTLGTKLDEQLIDRALLNGYSRFMLHYNFPSFSTGEVKFNRGPGRREIGHGHLAMRALKKVLPLDTENPYTIRIVSDILESNGSSSMATVCAGSLALMDAGISIRSAVSGIAMGLLMDEQTGKHAILSDILGDEDALGDMDFKVAGTAKGITACQMDIKVSGLTPQLLQKALEQAKAGRLHILGEMNKTITEPKTTYKKHAPSFSTMTIPKNMIGAVIGPSGKIVQEMQRETGTTIIIEEVEGKGIIKFFGPNQEAVQSAEKRVKDIVAEPVVGDVYQGTVKSIVPFGAFVEFMPGKEGLLHISEVKWERIENLDQVLELGEVIPVKLLEIDPKSGKYKLSRKVLLPNPKATEA